MKKRYYLTTIFTIVLCLFVTLSACMKADEMPSEGDAESIEVQESELIASDDSSDESQDNDVREPILVSFSYTEEDIINYAESVAKYKPPDVEHNVEVQGDCPMFPQEMQDILISVNNNEAIPEEYILQTEILSGEAIEAFPQDVLAEMLDDENGYLSGYKPYAIQFVDMNNDGQDEYVIYGSSVGSPCVVSQIDGEYELLSQYNWNKEFKILTYDNIVYALCDDRVEYYQSNDNAEDCWNRMEMDIMASGYDLIEVYSQADYQGIALLDDNIDIKELMKESLVSEQIINNEEFLIGVDCIITSNKPTGYYEYDHTITIVKMNQDGQPEVVKIYYAVADIQINFVELQRPHIYLMDEEMVKYN